MASTLGTNSSQAVITTPKGHVVILQTTYGIAEKRGVFVLIGAAGFSLLAVFGLLFVLGISICRRSRSSNVHRFMSTHVAAYLVSLLLSNLVSSIGSLMNVEWISAGGVHLGAFCTAQGASKNAGDVGTAMWSLIIAVHTFCVLVLKWRSSYYVLYATLLIVWSFIGLVVIIGPSAVQELAEKGPYFGIFGYWCWITESYATPARLALDYIWLFLAAGGSFILYTLVLLSVRVNHDPDSPASSLKAQTGQSSSDPHAASFAKHMIAYPIAYTVIVLPTAVCRFLIWTGRRVPLEATVAADAVFLLSGLINVVLFITTRRAVSARDALPFDSRAPSATPPLDYRKPPLAATVTPFVLTEKAASDVSSYPVSPGSSVSSSLPSFAPKEPRGGGGKTPLLQRNVARPPNLAPLRYDEPLPDVPSGRSTPQSEGTAAGAYAPKKPSPLRTPAVPQPAYRGSGATEEDRRNRESGRTETSSRYGPSSYYFTAPPWDPATLPPTPPLPDRPPWSGRGGGSTQY